MCEGEEEIRITTDVFVQLRLESACLDRQMRLFADQWADAGYETSIETWRQTGIE